MTDIDFNHASVIAIVLLLILNPPYVILLGKREPNHAAWTKGSDFYQRTTPNTKLFSLKYFMKLNFLI